MEFILLDIYVLCKFLTRWGIPVIFQVSLYVPYSD
jgi:hypothetical protein